MLGHEEVAGASGHGCAIGGVEWREEATASAVAGNSGEKKGSSGGVPNSDDEGERTSDGRVSTG